MLQLEIKKKLNRVLSQSSNLEDWGRWEDVLTATVFGFAVYLPYAILLGPILAKASLAGGSCQDFPTDVTDADICQAKLWPEIKDVLDHQPLGNTRRGKTDELDAIWSFLNFTLIIEAKRIGQPFKEDQLKKYCKAFKKSSKPLWVLTVGRGSQAVRSLARMDLGQDINLLYIDWQSILDVVTKQLSNDPVVEAYQKRCLRDIKESLETRDLKAFDGFYCQDKELQKIEMTVGGEWFPYSLWEILPDRISGMRSEFHRWLTKPLWNLNEVGFLNYSPIPWFTE